MISGQTAPEEIVNTLTHGLGLLLAMSGLVALILLISRHGDMETIVSCSIYGASLVLLYTSSTLYHSARASSVKKILKIIDHCCIYLLIAGTYTPLTLVLIRGDLGWTLFGITWGSALLGIIFKIFFTGRFELISTLIYLGLGWLCVVAIEPLYTYLSASGFILFVTGGLSYTLGALFFGLKKIPFHHGLFHLFVITGSICHYFSILSFVVSLR